MPDAVDAVGERIEQLLGELAGRGVAERAEELVRTLMEFYGAGLGRVVELLCEVEGGEPLLERLTADPVVHGLLVLHDLHPKSTLERVTEALDRVRPYLGSHAGDVDLVGIDDEGVLRLRLRGTCDGCPSSTVTVKYAIEKSIHEVAPEVSDIVVEGLVPESQSPQVGPNGRPLLPLEPIACPVPESA
jgi:Fe-S cluster biogenesis protein NfuA